MIGRPVPRAIGRAVLWSLAAILLVLTLAVGWVGVRGALAYQHLSTVQRDAAGAGAEVLSDPTSAGTLVARLSREATSAHDLTSDVVWKFSEGLPWVGPQLTAFADVSAAADQMLTDALLPLVKATQTVSLENLKPMGGRIETSMISALADPAASAAQDARTAADSVRAIDRTPLVGVLAAGVDQIDEVFAQMAAQIDALSRASRILPDALGQSGAKQYLVMVQNNAEWRSLGGIAGTAVLLRADSGTISLVATQSGTALTRSIKQPVLTLSSDLQSLYGEKPARYFQNVTQIPDFTIDGPLAKEMYRTATGISVDGVLAIDPVVLSYLLNATGPVSLPDGISLTSDNAVQLFLNDVYKNYPDPDQQDAFFAASTGKLFTEFLDDGGSTPKLLSALSRAADEQRIKIWMADEAQQAVLAGSSLAGGMPPTTETTAAFGLYLNESGGSKMSFYVRPDVSMTWNQCRTSGRPGIRELTLSVTLQSNAPLDASSTLPPYMTAEGRFGVAPGNAATVGNIFLPPGWELVSSTTSDGTGITNGAYEGRRVLTFQSNLAPQTSSTTTVTVRSVLPTSEAEVYVTPTADADVAPVIRQRCAAPSLAQLR